MAEPVKVKIKQSDIDEIKKAIAPFVKGEEESKATAIEVAKVLLNIVAKRSTVTLPDLLKSYKEEISNEKYKHVEGVDPKELPAIAASTVCADHLRSATSPIKRFVFRVIDRSDLEMRSFRVGGKKKKKKAEGEEVSVETVSVDGEKKKEKRENRYVAEFLAAGIMEGDNHIRMIPGTLFGDSAKLIEKLEIGHIYTGEFNFKESKAVYRVTSPRDGLKLEEFKGKLDMPSSYTLVKQLCEKVDCANAAAMGIPRDDREKLQYLEGTVVSGNTFSSTDKNTNMIKKRAVYTLKDRSLTYEEFEAINGGITGWCSYYHMRFDKKSYCCFVVRTRVSDEGKPSFDIKGIIPLIPIVLELPPESKDSEETVEEEETTTNSEDEDIEKVSVTNDDTVVKIGDDD